jgi:hypothetical protein
VRDGQLKFLGMVDVGVILSRFEAPNDTDRPKFSKIEVVNFGRMSIGRATYRTGWKWSLHLDPGLGFSSCSVEHFGIELYVSLLFGGANDVYPIKPY